MKKFLKSLLIPLSLVIGVAALVGGSLMHPDGSRLGLSASFPEDSAFSDCLVPILNIFSLIGILSLVISISICLTNSTLSWLSLSEIMTLTVWMTVQLAFVPPVFLHLVIAMTSAFLLTKVFISLQTSHYNA